MQFIGTSSLQYLISSRSRLREYRYLIDALARTFSGNEPLTFEHGSVRYTFYPDGHWGRQVSAERRQVFQIDRQIMKSLKYYKKMDRLLLDLLEEYHKQEWSE
ncbi:MAG: hypothetical protein COT55_01885 [Candidatus Diapherotrites archaeon CG09_land_8_20_14_0_10_32_12]|nr:MAG: hypothetical protein COT55_01885 [Candidatus Diapherotrites archaeon CG09_land_8_20_14_0_10_32_12]